jgi:hypothetical protein
VNEVVVHVIVEDGQLEVGRGPLPGAPVIDPGPTLIGLLTHRLSVEAALATRTVAGDPEVLEAFVSMFALPDRPMVAPSVG